MDAAPGCRLQRRSSANILTAWPGRVAQAPRAGRARAPWSFTPCWRPSSITARLEDMLEDKLGLDHEANSQITDGGATGSRLPGGTSVGRRFANVFQRQRGPADPPEAGFCARRHPPYELDVVIFARLCDIRCELDLKRIAQKNKHDACVLTLSSHTQLLHCLLTRSSPNKGTTSTVFRDTLREVCEHALSFPPHLRLKGPATAQGVAPRRPTIMPDLAAEGGLRG